MASVKFPGIPNKEIIWGWDASLSTDILVPIKATDNALHVYSTNGVDFVDVTNSVASVEMQLDYETVAASQTDQTLGVTGATGDLLHSLLVVPATTGAGSISIKDGAGGAISVFVAGTLSDLTPFSIGLSIVSTAGAWSVTTGANVSVIACGRFAV